MILPPPIAAYFAADAARDAAGLGALFAPDAEVHDEGATHRGPDTIRAWWQAAKARYNHTALPLDQRSDGAKIVVRARVSGDFPGSPAVLDFSFGLAAARIRDLRIG